MKGFGVAAKRQELSPEFPAAEAGEGIPWSLLPQHCCEQRARNRAGKGGWEACARAVLAGQAEKIQSTADGLKAPLSGLARGLRGSSASGGLLNNSPRTGNHADAFVPFSCKTEEMCICARRDSTHFKRG